MPYCRCVKCGARKTLTPEQEAKGLAGPKCACGSRRWRIDKYRTRVERAPYAPKPCYCGHYPYPHRKGSGMCEHNPNLTEEDFENMRHAARNRKTYGLGS